MRERCRTHWGSHLCILMLSLSPLPVLQVKHQTPVIIALRASIIWTVLPNPPSIYSTNSNISSLSFECNKCTTQIQYLYIFLVKMFYGFSSNPLSNLCQIQAMIRLTNQHGWISQASNAKVKKPPLLPNLSWVMISRGCFYERKYPLLFARLVFSLKPATCPALV